MASEPRQHPLLTPHTTTTTTLLLLLLFYLLLLLPSSTTAPPPPSSSSSYYHGSIDLDFLCKSRTLPAYVRDVPWDCGAYVVCVRGRAVHSQCPLHQVFSVRGRGGHCVQASPEDTDRCRGQLFVYTDQLCQDNPTARVPSPDSCSHYLDCAARRRSARRVSRSIGASIGQVLHLPLSQLSGQVGHQPEANSTGQETSANSTGQETSANSTGQQTSANSTGQAERQGSTEPKGQTGHQTTTGSKRQAAHSTGGAVFMEGLLECPYPLLFSPDVGQCQRPQYVRCLHKFEPKAPCDYIQYLQLYNCARRDCQLCEKHHPSCLHLPDGLHPVPQRSDVIMKCQGQRTVDFVTCPPSYVVSQSGTSPPECVRSRRLESVLGAG